MFRNMKCLISVFLTLLLIMPVIGYTKAPMVLRIQQYPGTISILSEIAIEQGYCAKYNLNCELQVLHSAPLGIQTLLAGGIQVAQPATGVALHAMAHGVDLKIAAGAYVADPFILVVGPNLFNMAKKGYPAMMKELKGKRIGVIALGSSSEFQARTLFTAAGIKHSSATYVAVGTPNTSYPALLHKGVDAVIGIVPMGGICHALKTCKVALSFAKGEGPKVLTATNGGGGFYVVTRKFAEKHPAAVAGFHKAIHDAAVFLHNPANFQRVLEISSKYFSVGMPKGDEIVKFALKNTRDGFSANVDRKAVQAVEDYLLKTGQLKKPVDVGGLFR